MHDFVHCSTLTLHGFRSEMSSARANSARSTQESFHDQDNHARRRCRVGAGAQRPDGVGAGDPGVRFAGSGQDSNDALSTPRLNRVIRERRGFEPFAAAPRDYQVNQPTTYDWHVRDVSPY